MKIKRKFAAGMENFSVNNKSMKIMHLAKDDEPFIYGLYRSQNIPDVLYTLI